MTTTPTETPCCDLGTNDPTGDEDGIWIAVCKHLLEGNFERFWNDDDDQDDGTPVDPAYPVLYVGKTKRDDTDELNQLPWQGCANDDCPDTKLCLTHFEAL